MAIDNKKEQEREELHRAIWAIADELRGAVDGWDFKNYVLGTMFYRYISENIAFYINQGEIDAGNTSFDYAKMNDSEAETARDGLVEEKGFFILPSELFCNVLKRCDDDENLNETLEKVFRHIEESAKGSASESDFEGLFDDFDVNSNKLGSTVAKRNDKLAKLLHGVADMNLGDVKDHDIDAFGDAYEYLMTMYASNAGKSGGEFFTPADVDTSLECSVCGERVAAWFLVDSDGMIEIPAPKLRITKRSIKYSDYVKPAYDYDEKYGILLENAEIAFREGLGAGSIIYLRKIFEMVTDGIADAEGINVCTDRGKKKPFSQRLDLVKAEVDFIPKEFSDDGYRLFGELSDVVHGEFDEEEGLKKYQTLKRLVVGVLDNIKNRADFAEARARLGWTNEEG